jgi:hypothetical protein
MKNILPWVLIVVLAVAVGLQWMQMRELTSSLKKSDSLIAERLNSFDSKLGRATTKIDANGSMLETLRNEIPQDVRAEIEELGVQVEAIGRATVVHRSSGGGQARRVATPPLHEAPRVLDNDPVGRRGKSSSNSEVIEFQDWRLKARLTDGTFFTYELHQQFDFLLVEGSRGEGSPTYIRMWEKDEDGNRIEPALEVSSFEIVRREKESGGWEILNPKLEIALHSFLRIRDASLGLAPEIALSVGSYGLTEDDLTWRLMRVGAFANEQTIGISICPGSYNLGKDLPLVSNVWISPCYSYSGEHSAGLSVGGTL